MIVSRYQDFVDGMCFRGVWGFTAIVASYVASAVLTIFLVILVYLRMRCEYSYEPQTMRPKPLACTPCSAECWRSGY